jgi:hypothetical protein
VVVQENNVPVVQGEEFLAVREGNEHVLSHGSGSVCGGSCRRGRGEPGRAGCR